MVRLQVGLDFDGVVVMDRGREFARWLEEEKGWKINYDILLRDGSWTIACGKGREHLNNAYEEFTLHESAPPLMHAPDVQERLQEISSVKDCLFHLVTSRKGKAFQQAFEVIRMFSVSFGSHTGECFGGKIEVMREKSLHILFEDNPFELTHISSRIAVGEQLFAVQFPSFFFYPGTIHHRNIYRLPVCDDVERWMRSSEAPIPQEDQVELLNQAWVEARHWTERIAEQL